MKRFANVSIPSIKKIIHTSFEKQLLKSCSVRLFILIHFYANANTGITSPLDLEDLAQALDCNIKTVRSNILRLESCGFFDVSMDLVTEEYTFTIHDYTKMYNPIGLGGGYIQCTYDLLEQLLQIKSINELRVILMLLCEAITTELQSSAKLAVAKLTFKELLAGLPKYVKLFLRKSTPGKNAILLQSSMIVLMERLPKTRSVRKPTPKLFLLPLKWMM